MRRPERSKKEWAHEELQYLRWSWGQARASTIARRLKRSAAACYHKAAELGLGSEWEGLSLAECAKRSGYDLDTLRKVLAFAGVRPRRSQISRKGRVKHWRWSVDPDGLERAVALWTSTAPVGVHAREYGVSGIALRQWLEDAGHKPPRGSRRRHWRVSSEVVAKVMAAVTARQTAPKLRDHADAFGVSERRLRCALEAAGYRRAGRVWLVSEDDARRALEVWDAGVASRRRTGGGRGRGDGRGAAGGAAQAEDPAGAVQRA